LIESIVGTLIPPICREEVLGDWSERYRTTTQYLWDAIKTLPFIIVSQARRAFRIELFLAEACALYAAFSGASLARGPAYLYDNSSLLSLGIVIGVSLFMLTVGDAYAHPRDESHWKVQLPVGLALTFAYCVRATLGLLSPALMLPGLVMLIGTGLSLP